MGTLSENVGTTAASAQMAFANIGIPVLSPAIVSHTVTFTAKPRPLFYPSEIAGIVLGSFFLLSCIACLYAWREYRRTIRCSMLETFHEHVEHLTHLVIACAPGARVTGSASQPCSQVPDAHLSTLCVHRT